jgi:hypothetical protein
VEYSWLVLVLVQYCTSTACCCGGGAGRGHMMAVVQRACQEQHEMWIAENK